METRPAHTRWSLVLSSYSKIGKVVMEDSRVMALLASCYWPSTRLH